MAIEKKLEVQHDTTERKLSAREMMVKRTMEEREDRHWEREAVRVDNNTGHDDQ